MNIKGKVVTLRAIEKEDLELLREMLNDSEMENLVVGWSFPVSKYQQEKWYENSINDKNNLRFIVEVEGEALGLATLTDIDWKNRKAFHGMKLAKQSNRRRGIGRDTVMAIMKYAFDELQLNRLDGSWFEENIPSKTMYMKCGWKEEGRLREYIFKNGRYRDLISTGVLKKEYDELIEMNNYWSEK
ncbi:GNAT family N-acetyltransferase [Fusobacterium necrogenes]|uniref:GNAT family N-acetyltransferase n=1 Tax=Fusobacterium necrogenes TaxID=858 RepID=UPI00255C8324|nr:GNAT family protein [Fusobacterium necrogenes]